MKQHKQFSITRIIASILIMIMAAGIFPAANADEVQAGTGTAIYLDKETLTMYPGDKETLTMYIGNMAAASGGWSSSNKKVATVNKKGVVTAKKAGKATIKCKTGYGFSLCKVKVGKRTELSKLLNNNYKKLVKKSQFATFTNNDPLSQGNLYVFPDNSLFLRFNKNTKKADILQNSYNKKLMLYGVYIGQSGKKAKSTLKKKKWKLTNTVKPDTRTVLTYKKGKHQLTVWIDSGKVTCYQWIR